MLAFNWLQSPSIIQILSTFYPINRPHPQVAATPQAPSSTYPQDNVNSFFVENSPLNFRPSTEAASSSPPPPITTTTTEPVGLSKVPKKLVVTHPRETPRRVENHLIFNSEPSVCFTHGDTSSQYTLVDLVNCLNDFTTPPHHFNAETYAEAQPSKEEMDAWLWVVDRLMDMKEEAECELLGRVLGRAGDESELLRRVGEAWADAGKGYGFASLAGGLSKIREYYQVSVFSESSSKTPLETKYRAQRPPSFCVLSETSSDNGYYVKGWGTFVVPVIPTQKKPSCSCACSCSMNDGRDGSQTLEDATMEQVRGSGGRQVPMPRFSGLQRAQDRLYRHANRALPQLRNLHLSAPHPMFDRGTAQQAAAVFQGAGGKSLLIPGRSRLSFDVPTACVDTTGMGSKYWKTDAAHDDVQPFFNATTRIHDWQMRNGGCSPDTCVFLQLHGKGTRTCAADTIFLSAGLGRDKSSLEWYAHSPAAARIKRLQRELSQAHPHFKSTIPTQSQCSLVATKNIAGRYINGVQQSDVCRRNPVLGMESGTEDEEKAGEVDGGSGGNIADGDGGVRGDFIHVEQALSAREKESYGGWIKAVKGAFVEL